MADRQTLLDSIVARTSPQPQVQALGLPAIEWWEPGRVWCAWIVDPDLVQPIRDGVMDIEAFVMHEGRSTIFIEVTGATGTLYAKGSATQSALRS